MNEINNKLLRILFYADLNPLRVILAISELMWAISLIWPGSTMSREAYRVLWSIWPYDEAWGVLFLFTGVSQLYIVLSNCLHTKCARMFAGYNAALWAFVSTSMYIGIYPPPAGTSSGVAMAAASAWVFVRTGWIPQGGRRRAGDQ